ncbi:MAG TPA: sugar phosphate isomerase/epimerase family protein [Terriglobia bacterium]|nr:sugar phosphate isomerase/epimerase family protein [Terriglobia bacterium]
MTNIKRRTFLRNLAAASGAPLLAGGLPSFSGPGTPSAPPLTRFKLGVISDELSKDFEEALKTMKSYGLSWVEIRTVWGTYNTEASPEQLQRIKDPLEKFQFKVSVLDTALFKCALPGTKPVAGGKDAYPYAGQMDLLKRAMDRAPTLGTDKLRVFAFYRVAEPESRYSQIAEELSKAAELALSGGMRLVLEDEGSCNVATGHELAEMLKRVPAANFGANWDVGNGVSHGEVSYPDGYAALDKKRIWHMHIKDIRCGAAATSKEFAEAFKKKKERVVEKSKCHTAIVGAGQVDLLGQLRALLRNNYQGTMSLEPEYEAPGLTHFEATRRSLVALLRLMAHAAG